MTRLETVHKKYTELLADMKKLDRDYSKSKKRSDQLQKDQDKGKSELNKTVTMKDKLEKLCRELTKENKKVKVSGDPGLSGISRTPPPDYDLNRGNIETKHSTNTTMPPRMRTRNWRKLRRRHG